MNRQEFIDNLRSSLNGRLPAAMVEDNVNYYQDYIHVELRKGRSEEEVLAALGNPRLIARTIIETSGQDLDPTEEVGREQQYDGRQTQNRGWNGQRQGWNGQRQGWNGQSQSWQTQTRDSYSPKVVRLPGWLMAILGVGAAVAIVGLVFSVLSFFAPVLVVLAVVFFMVRLFRHWLD